MNIELVDTEFVSCEPLITTFSGKDLYINLFCVLLFRDILLYIHYSLALTSWPIALMPEQSLSNTYIFSVRHTTTFLHLGRLDHSSALCMGAILNSKSTNKHKNVTDVSLNRLQKGCWFTLWTWNMRAELDLVPPPLRTGVLGSSNFLLLCLCTCPSMTRRLLAVLISRLQIHFNE